MKKRLVYIDFLRIISIIGIVASDVLKEYLGNINNLGNSNTYIATMFVLFLRFCIPMFFMINGAIVLRKKSSEDKIARVRYRIKKLLLPLITWSLIYNFFNYYIMGKGSYSILEFVRVCFFSIIEDRAFGHLWFIYVILSLYAIAPFLASMLNNSSKKEVQYLLKLWLITNIVYNTVANFYPEVAIGQSLYIAFFNIPILINYTGYFILGYYLGTYDIKVEGRRLYSLLVLAILTIPLYFSVFKFNINYFNNYSTLATFLIASCIFTIAKSFDYEKIKEEKKLFLKSFSQSAMGIYFIHLIVLFELKEKLAYMTNPYAYVLLNIFLVYIISYIIVKLSNLDKRLSYILGT